MEKVTYHKVIFEGKHSAEIYTEIRLVTCGSVFVLLTQS
jgi:hypothetical protein